MCVVNAMEDSGYGSLIVDKHNGTSSTSTSLSLSPNQSFQTSDFSRKRKCDSGIECGTPSFTDNFSDSDTSEFVSPAKRALTDSLASLCKIQSEPNSPQPTTVTNVTATRSLRKVVSFDCTPSYNELSVELPKRPQSVLGRKRTRSATKSNDYRQIIIEKSIRLQQRHLDFMTVFACESNNMNIISEIFSYLNDDDLRTVSRVSRLWRRVLYNDKTAYERYLLAEDRFIVSKENRIFELFATLDTSNLLTTQRSPPRSPTSEKHNKFIKIAEKLQDMQTLTKCPTCENPAIIEDNIAECTKCVRIWCIRCLRDVSTESKNRSPSPRTELKEISPNTKADKLHKFNHSQPYFFYHNEDSCSSSSSSNSDDHLIRKYFIASNGNEPDPNQRSSSNNVSHERRIIPKIPIKRALSFSKCSTKCAVLSDFSNTIINNSSSTESSRISKNFSAILSSSKRKTYSRLHICHEASTNSPSADESNVTTSPKDRKTTKRRLRRLCR